MRRVVVDFGLRLRRLRKIAGLTQTELAALAKLHYTYIGAVERGERNLSLQSLGKIAKGLGREINEFFPSPVIFTPEEDTKDEIMEALRGRTLKDLKLILQVATARCLRTHREKKGAVVWER